MVKLGLQQEGLLKGELRAKGIPLEGGMHCANVTCAIFSAGCVATA